MNIDDFQTSQVYLLNLFIPKMWWLKIGHGQ